MIANDCASLPVPAVVGTPIDGSIGRVALLVAAVVAHRSAVRQHEIDALRAVERAAAADRHDGIDTAAAARTRPASTMFVSGFGPKSWKRNARTPAARAHRRLVRRVRDRPLPGPRRSTSARTTAHAPAHPGARTSLRQRSRASAGEDRMAARRGHFSKVQATSYPAVSDKAVIGYDNLTTMEAAKRSGAASLVEWLADQGARPRTARE